MGIRSVRDVSRAFLLMTTWRSAYPPFRLRRGSRAADRRSPWRVVASSARSSMSSVRCRTLRAIGAVTLELAPAAGGDKPAGASASAAWAREHPRKKNGNPVKRYLSLVRRTVSDLAPRTLDQLSPRALHGGSNRGNSIGVLDDGMCGSAEPAARSANPTYPAGSMRERP
jgi:hypothetical protein